MKQPNSQAGVPSGPVQLATPRVAAVTAPQQSCSHPTAAAPPTAASLHAKDLPFQKTHRSRSFYSSRHLNEMNLYIPDSSQNLNYCGNKPWVHLVKLNYKMKISLNCHEVCHSQDDR